MSLDDTMPTYVLTWGANDAGVPCEIRIHFRSIESGLRVPPKQLDLGRMCKTRYYACF